MNHGMRLAALTLLAGTFGCGSGGNSSSGTSSNLSISFSSGSVQASLATAGTVTVTLTRSGNTGSVTLTVQGLPSGASAQIQSPGSGNGGSITFAVGTAVSGSYPVTVTANDGRVSGSATLTLVINASALSLSLSSGGAQVYQNQSTATVFATVTRTATSGNVTLTVEGVPASVTWEVRSPGAGNSGSIIFTANQPPNPPSNPPNLGNFTITVSASDGQVSGSATTTLTVGAYVEVFNTQSSAMQLAMSTSFQPAEWDSTFFTTNPGATTPLHNLQPSHIRLQAVSQGVPETAQDTWNFSVVDAITQPVLGVGDQKPEFQIAVAPAFLYDAKHNFLDPSYAQFATYAQQLVRYYNMPGFDVNGTHYQSPSVDTINLWGIYNEPNINNLDATQYTNLYNTVVPAMRTVDNTLRFVAVELLDSGGSENEFLPTFVTGVTAQVDVLATHFYSTCNQKDPDQKVFDTVPTFGKGVANIYSILVTPPANPALKTVPVWVTENNVNADFDKGGGISACNGTTFVRDPRGSSAFFAAWRPYVFSRLGKAGAAALYQWVFAGDAQYGELDDQTGQPRLSYWIDYWLQHKFPAPPGTTLLDYAATDDAELETLVARNSDGTVIVMVANHAVNAPADNNGPGAPRSVLVDTTALGLFQTASLLTIDANTDLTNGPTAVSVSPVFQIPITFNGYGVAFLTLK